MRDAEADIAEALSNKGWLTVLDGPLHGIRHRRGLPVIGYVKTHHRRMLAREHWVRVPELTAGERSGLLPAALRYATPGRYQSTRRCALPVAAAVRKRGVPLSRDGMSLMYLVQEHANRGCHLHGKPCVMGIEPYVPRRASMPCAERIAQLCKAPPERRDIIH